MPKYVVIEKPVGLTPLQALEEYRKADPRLAEVSLTYAGRLDPMASGKLVILIGDECKNRQAYDALDKEYVFEVLLGCTTDTGDVLGLVDVCNTDTSCASEDVLRITHEMQGKHTFPYPAFSSKAVNGVPLFQYALENRLHEIQIPTVHVKIYELACIDAYSISRDTLVAAVVQKITMLRTDPNDTRLGSDFRKSSIIAAWQQIENTRGDFHVLKFRSLVSSGTYIRTLAPLLAEKLGTGGLAYSIHRTRIIGANLCDDAAKAHSL